MLGQRPNRGTASCPICPLLRVQNLSVSYGHVNALSDVTLSVPAGGIVSIVGANGAGKSSLLSAVSGIVRPRAGNIFFRDQALPRDAYHVVKQGIVHVPEGRQIFPGLSVLENLKVGAYVLEDAERVQENLERMFALYPILSERRHQQAGTLSGGEQQMLAICRGLMSNPSLLLLDEPSLGLAPIVVNGVFETIRDICSQGITVVLVEQNAKRALEICDYAYVLENGRIVLEGEGYALLENCAVKEAYLGGAVA